MDPQFRILILTDHRIHSPVESIYPIARSLTNHANCSLVHVASSGSIENESFFSNPTPSKLSAIAVDDNFQYSENGICFQHPSLLVDPRSYDVVLLRLPRSKSMEFFARIEQVIPKFRMINQPLGIAETGSKEYLLNFPDLCPPLMLCNNMEDVRSLRDRFAFVLKPFNNSGGKGLVRIDGNKVYEGQNEYHWDDYLPTLEGLIGQGYLGMKFLKNVHQGDKRIIVANRKVVAAALRTPPAGSWLCNVSMGATSTYAEPDEQELEIARKVIPDLYDKGVILFGMDTLVDDDGRRVLSELNTSCVNGIYPAEITTGRPITQETANLLMEYIIDQIPLL